MVRKALRHLAIFGACWLAASEIWLQHTLARYQEFVAFRTVRSRPDLTPERHFLGAVEAEVSWSAGNKTYRYLRLYQGRRRVLDFWGTNSWSRKPEVWLESGAHGQAPRILTYQPGTIPSSTPCGEVRSGFLIWEFDGQSYRATRTWLCPLSYILRNPIPFQD